MEPFMPAALHAGVPPFDAAVVVGRFQPLHDGHLALLQRALAIARHCVVVIGSAHQARTPRNPFTWSERAEMIRLALAAEGRDRVRFLPVRDYYDTARWARAVHARVEAMLAQAPSTGPAPRVALVGHFGEAQNGWLSALPDWPVERVDCVDGVGGARILDALFGADPEAIEETLAALVDQVPASTIAFLHAWAALPFHGSLSEEWRALRRYREEWKAAPYPPVFVTVDAVVRCAGHVLLIRRGHAPGRGLQAVPGGFVEQRESLWHSCLRELEEETHVALLEESLRAGLREVAVFDHPDRSQRGRTITHAHYFDLGERPLPELRADDDAQAAEWVPITRLASMEDHFHDDHFHMLDHFLGLTSDEDAE
jgi:bifunctional NMN adenylyltransferase/nudix hydrolase